MNDDQLNEKLKRIARNIDAVYAGQVIIISLLFALLALQCS